MSGGAIIFCWIISIVVTLLTRCACDGMPLWRQRHRLSVLWTLVTPVTLLHCLLSFILWRVEQHQKVVKKRMVQVEADYQALLDLIEYPRELRTK